MSNRNSVSQSAWSGKTAMVVGASAGLGRKLAEALAEQRAARILLVARDAERLRTVAGELAEKWPETRCVAVAADVSSAAGAAALEQQLAVRDPETSIHLLINAVGLSDRGPALSLTAERIDELMRANVHAPLLVVQTLAHRLAPGGVIVNIGSLSSHFAPRFLGGYSLAKHALRALTQQLRLELKERGLHVMLVCPGPIADSERAQSRYAHLPTASEIPREALAGGGGAKLRGLDARELASEILHAAAARKLELIRPRKAKWLVWLMALWPSWGEAILRRKTQ